MIFFIFTIYFYTFIEPAFKMSEDRTKEDRSIFQGEKQRKIIVFGEGGI